METEERYSDPHVESIAIENSQRFRRRLSVGMSARIDEETINCFSRDQLMKKIHRIEEENRNLQSENLLYSRYLRRVESSKILETFEEYGDKDLTILPEGRVITNQTAVRVKLPEIARRSSMRRNSIHPTKVSPSWSKLVSDWREHIYTPLLLRVEQEKLTIAAYEIEQTRLDWDRMKTNAALTLDHFDNLLRAAESDEATQETLLVDFKQNIDQLHRSMKVEKLTDSRFIILAELMSNHIRKQINSRISSNDVLRVNNTNTQLRIRALGIATDSLDDIHDAMDEIDLDFVRRRKYEYFDTYEKLERRYKMEKSRQYSVFCRWQKWRKILTEEEKKKLACEQKYEFVQNYSRKLEQEIQSIELENKSIAKENLRIGNRITDVRKVPTINDYAHVIAQTKRLQHEIDIWSQRKDIAQTLLVQLNRQTKSPNVLPSIEPTSIVRTAE